MAGGGQRTEGEGRSVRERGVEGEGEGWSARSEPADLSRLKEIAAFVVLWRDQLEIVIPGDGAVQSIPRGHVGMGWLCTDASGSHSSGGSVQVHMGSACDRSGRG